MTTGLTLEINGKVAILIARNATLSDNDDFTTFIDSVYRPIGVVSGAAFAGSDVIRFGMRPGGTIICQAANGVGLTLKAGVYGSVAWTIS